MGDEEAATGGNLRQDEYLINGLQNWDVQNTI